MPNSLLNQPHLHFTSLHHPTTYRRLVSRIITNPITTPPTPLPHLSTHLHVTLEALPTTMGITPPDTGEDGSITEESARLLIAKRANIRSKFHRWTQLLEDGLDEELPTTEVLKAARKDLLMLDEYLYEDGADDQTTRKYAIMFKQLRLVIDPEGTSKTTSRSSGKNPSNITTDSLFGSLPQLPNINMSHPTQSHGCSMSCHGEPLRLTVAC